MMNDVENEVEKLQAEDGLVNCVPELKQLSEDIDKTTNTFINAALELESTIQQYQRAEAKLGGAVTTISTGSTTFIVPGRCNVSNTKDCSL